MSGADRAFYRGRPSALRIAESLGRQPLDQLLAASKQLALACKAYLAGDQVKLARLRPEVRPLDVDLHQVALARHVLQRAKLTAKDLARESRVAVGEREPQHTACRRLGLLHLPLDRRRAHRAHSTHDQRRVFADGQCVGIDRVHRQTKKRYVCRRTASQTGAPQPARCSSRRPPARPA